LIFLELEK